GPRTRHEGEGVHCRTPRTLRPHHFEADLFLLGQRPASRRALGDRGVPARAELLLPEHHRRSRAPSISQEPHPCRVALRLGLRPAAAYLLFCNRECTISASARTADRHPERLSFPVSTTAPANVIAVTSRFALARP